MHLSEIFLPEFISTGMYSQLFVRKQRTCWKGSRSPAENGNEVFSPTVTNPDERT